MVISSTVTWRITVHNAGAEAAAKKWRGLINIHDLDVRTFRIFD